MTYKTNDLFEYLDLLIKAGHAGHRLNREVSEAVEAIRESLNLNRKDGIKISRPDGVLLLSENGLHIKNGAIKVDFPNKAKIHGNFFLINSQEDVNLTAHSIKHESRFLRLNINFKPYKKCGHFELIVTDGTDIYGSMTTKVFKDSSFSLFADLGEPTGQTKTLYVNAKSLDKDSDTLVRIESMCQEG